jgi:hypothetical protein
VNDRDRRWRIDTDRYGNQIFVEQPPIDVAPVEVPPRRADRAWAVMTASFWAVIIDSVLKLILYDNLTPLGRLYQVVQIVGATHMAAIAPRWRYKAPGWWPAILGVGIVNALGIIAKLTARGPL